MTENKPDLAEQLALMNVTAAIGKLNYYMQTSALYVLTDGKRNPTGIEVDDEKDKVVEFTKAVKFSFKAGEQERGLIEAIMEGLFQFTPDEVYAIIGRYLGWRFGIKENANVPDSEEAPLARMESDWIELSQNMIEFLEGKKKEAQERSEALRKSMIYTPEASRQGKAFLDSRGNQSL